MGEPDTSGGNKNVCDTQNSGVLTGRLSCVPWKPARQIASAEPTRSRTQRAFLKPRSAAPSSVHLTPDLLRSASRFRNARSVHMASNRRQVDRPSLHPMKALSLLPEYSMD